MNRETIENKAKAQAEIYMTEAPYQSGPLGSYRKGFIEGANWRINSVWHDADKELPDCGRHVVNEDWFDFIAKDEKDLKRILKKYPFKQWAYIDDLLPERKEESK